MSEEQETKMRKIVKEEMLGVLKDFKFEVEYPNRKQEVTATEPKTGEEDDCPECGQRTAKPDKYCRNCGTEFED